MAKLIEDTLYRVQVDSEYHMEFVSAKDVEDLIERLNRRLRDSRC